LLNEVENIIELDSSDQRTINQYFINSNGDNKIKLNVQVKFDEESSYQLEKNNETIRRNNDVNKEDEKDKMVDISLTKDILPFIIPLICILTINTDHTDVLEMLKLIKDDLIKVFDRLFGGINQML
jgi:hypothetical protein